MERHGDEQQTGLAGGPSSGVSAGGDWIVPKVSRRQHSLQGEDGQGWEDGQMGVNDRDGLSTSMRLLGTAGGTTENRTGGGVLSAQMLSTSADSESPGFGWKGPPQRPSVDVGAGDDELAEGTGAGAAASREIPTNGSRQDRAVKPKRKKRRKKKRKGKQDGPPDQPAFAEDAAAAAGAVTLREFRQLVERAAAGDGPVTGAQD